MKRICTFIAAVMVLVSSVAWAGEQTLSSILNQKFSAYGGVQLYNADGTFRSNKDGLPNSKIDIDDLGLEEKPLTPVFGARVNFGKKWTLRFDYYGYHDDSKETIDREFNFDDEVFNLGARVDSSLDLDVYAVNMSYNFIATERARFGVGVGVNVADIDLEISAEVSVNGETQEKEKGDISFTGPLPNIYVSGAYAFRDRLILIYTGGWMSLSYDDYDGDLVFANASLEYWPFRYAGVGVGYRYVKADIKYDPGHKKEEYDVKLPGPMLYATFGF